MRTRRATTKQLLKESKQLVQEYPHTPAQLEAHEAQIRVHGTIYEPKSARYRARKSRI